MKYTGKKVTDHDFYCTRCGRKGIPICRTGRTREVGHLKYIYCINCKDVTNHAECNSGSGYSADDFIREYKSGNFNNEGKRIISFSRWKAKQGTFLYANI